MKGNVSLLTHNLFSIINENIELLKRIDGNIVIVNIPFSVAAIQHLAPLTPQHAQALMQATPGVEGRLNIFSGLKNSKIPESSMDLNLDFLRVTVLVAWLIFATLGCVPRSAAGPECGVSECCDREVRCSRVRDQKCTE